MPKSIVPASVPQIDPLPPVSSAPRYDRGDDEQPPAHTFGLLARADLSGKDHPCHVRAGAPRCGGGKRSYE